MNVKQFKEQLSILENKLKQRGLNEEEILVCTCMLTNELGTTCSFVENVYISPVHKELITIEGCNIDDFTTR